MPVLQQPLRLAILSLLTIFLGFQSLAEERDSKPNILLIVADDLGFSDLGCYGGEIETPNLDRLAASGLRLTQFYTTGRCCPSRAALLTGYYPHRIGLGHMTQDIGMPGYRGRVSDEIPVIAERLAKSGYRSFLSGKWHLGTDDPTKHGFEEFYGTLTSAKTFWDREHFLRLPVGRKPKPYAENKFYGTDALADHALEFIELSSETPDKPWFLYLAFNAPHFPLHAPEEAISKYAKKYSQGWDTLRHERLIQMIELGVIPKDTQLSVRSPHYDWGESKSAPNPDWNSLPSDRRADLSRRMAIYAAMVDRMDENIGRLINYLEASGELDNTLLIFTSDNGACAEWDEHGFDLKSGTDNILHRGEELLSMGQKGTFHSVGSGWANVSNTPWRLYKHFNHEGGISVPCIIHWPARLVSRRGQIDRTPTHLIDIAPTLLDVSISGSPVVDEANPLPGRSLVELIQGGDSADRTLFFEHEGNRAVREGTWKLVALRNQDWELYDLRNDRIESNDLSINHPQVVRRLSEAWDQWALENRVTPLPNDYRVEYLPNH